MEKVSQGMEEWTHKIKNFSMVLDLREKLFDFKV